MTAEKKKRSFFETHPCRVFHPSRLTVQDCDGGEKRLQDTRFINAAAGKPASQTVLTSNILLFSLLSDRA